MIDPAGSAVRHRHPMNVSPSAGDAILQVEAYRSTDADWVAARDSIPLERLMDNGANGPRQLPWLPDVPRGSRFVAGHDGLGQRNAGQGPEERCDERVQHADPRHIRAALILRSRSALLRADHRTVCEACHEK